MIGCLRTRVRKHPIIALYFESENELKLYSLEAWFPLSLAKKRTIIARPLLWCLVQSLWQALMSFWVMLSPIIWARVMTFCLTFSPSVSGIPAIRTFSRLVYWSKRSVSYTLDRMAAIILFMSVLCSDKRLSTERFVYPRTGNRSWVSETAVTIL